MKPKITPIDHEVVLSENEFIISKTDTKGIITYVNRTFMKISGYAEAELLGKQHNIIRHPDMPRGAFQVLWDTLQKGEEFFGYVKNLCKDGSYYWVFVNVTPDFDTRGQLRGYYSARRRPTRLAINTIIPIYQKMLEIENNNTTKEAIVHSTAYLNDTLHSLNTSYPHLILRLNETEAQA